MLTIRSDQMKRMADPRWTSFATRVAEHMAATFPDRIALMTPEEVRELIWQAAERAAKYDLGTEREVAAFADTMLLLGRSFDSDPRYRWALDILNTRYPE